MVTVSLESVSARRDGWVLNVVSWIPLKLNVFQDVGGMEVLIRSLTSVTVIMDGVEMTAVSSIVH